MNREIISNIMTKLNDALKGYGINSVISFDELKNDGITRYGITVSVNTSSVMPVLYLDDKLYNSLGIDGIVDFFTNKLDNMDENINVFEIFGDDLIGLEDKLITVLINYEENKEYLNRVPYKMFFDMAIVLKICDLSDDDEKFYSFTNEYLKRMNVDKDYIFERAKYNTELRYGSVIAPMSNLFGGGNFLQPEERDDVNIMSYFVNDMYIGTNDHLYYGSSILLYDNIMHNIYDIIKK